MRSLEPGEENGAGTGKSGVEDQRVPMVCAPDLNLMLVRMGCME